MKTAFAIVGAAYIAACILAKLGYADMQVCFVWKGSCSSPVPAAVRPWRPA